MLIIYSGLTDLRKLHIDVVVRFGYVRERECRIFYWYMCFCWCFWSSRCSCPGWNGRRPIFHAPGVYAGDHVVIMLSRICFKGCLICKIVELNCLIPKFCFYKFCSHSLVVWLHQELLPLV